MSPTPDPIPLETLRQLHRQTLDRREVVFELLNRARLNTVPLSAGIAQMSAPKTARISGLASDCVLLDARGISARRGRQLALHFDLDRERYFFVSRVLEVTGEGLVRLEFPQAIHVRETRDLSRALPRDIKVAPTRIEIHGDSGQGIPARVIDWSYHGMGVAVPDDQAAGLQREFRVRCLDGAQAGVEAYADLRHRGRLSSGWTRLGLAVSRVKRGPLLPIERREVLAASVARVESALSRPPPMSRRVEFRNDRGERLCGIVDSWGPTTGATAVVIPPAWGRTKETLLPLASTIVESFQAAGAPVVVLRFDGTRRRGESYVPPECAQHGLEHMRFAFSQAVEDTRSAVRFLRETGTFGCAKAVLVTFSLAAVEGRRVVALDRGRDLAGWVSVVGIADLQSALHTVSGGVDYGFGLLRGLYFGRQELFGVLVDIDFSGGDAVAHGLAFLEDARRDMAAIAIPVTWIHGRFDAWVDLERVRELLSCGDASQRRLLDVPTGHQLRSSAEAIETFRVVAAEVARMSIGREIATAPPSPARFLEQRAAERRHLRHGQRPLREFWRDYVLGRGGAKGIELLTATDLYREFMRDQITSLDLREGQWVADLGAGAGDFVLQLVAHIDAPPRLVIHEVDFVPQALSRGLDRLREVNGEAGIRVAPVVADLDLSPSVPGIPLASGRYDAVLASLLLGYLKHPEEVLREVRRLLRPGGLVVASALRRDADISKLYADSLADRYSSRPVETFGPAGPSEVDRSLPGLLNQAAQILDLEEQGRFRFFDPEELVDLFAAAGFLEIKVARSLGDPPQAVIVQGRNP